MIQEKESNKNITLQPRLSLLPLKNVVILPKSITPIIVGRSSSIKAVEYALKGDKSIFVTAQKNYNTENPTDQDVFQYGVKATIIQVMRMPNNALKILVEGINRVKIESAEKVDDFYLIEYKDVSSNSTNKKVELEAIWRQIKNLYSSYSKLNEKAPADLLSLGITKEDMDCLTDTIAIHLNLSFDERQEILELNDLKSRMLKIAALLNKEIEILETEQKIKGHIQNQVDKNQKEYYLNEQMKAINKELGREDQHAEITQLAQKIKALKLPAEIAEKANKELKRLEQMPPLSSEATVSRHYVDWIISLPWHKESKDKTSLIEAEKILNRSHAGLKKAKERIIEFLAAKKFSGSMEKAPVICFVGPPGVGKTSMASIISKSLNREFVRISLGGLRDEAEIRGHRRTYIGALPGKIIHAMKKAKTVNPVILLDEIDKISRDVNSDPSAALLEVLDPEQNKNFTDHFLDVEYDLSKVMFITTANMLDTIPYPLMDRMELIHLSGYTDAEKLEISRKFLIPKKLKEYSLKGSQFKITDEMLKSIIADYTKESGVRQIERVIAKLMRKAIQKILNTNVKSVSITENIVKEWMGNTKYKKTTLDPKSKDSIGIATGLAWTELGGEVLEIESSIIAGKGNMQLTGQLGEVMQESAQAATSYIRSRAKQLGIKDTFTSTKDIHVHIPEGATPKDGPSAGITMCTALVSALTKNGVRTDVAMTGEITLRGRVLAVGGLKEKILAAKQYKMKTIIVSQENKEDVEEVLKEIGDDIKVVYAHTMDDVLKAALEKNPFPRKRMATRSPKVKTISKATTKKKVAAKKR
jgi:ATP-dependent Lon protease